MPMTEQAARATLSPLIEDADDAETLKAVARAEPVDVGGATLRAVERVVDGIGQNAAVDLIDRIAESREQMGALQPEMPDTQRAVGTDDRAGAFQRASEQARQRRTQRRETAEREEGQMDLSTAAATRRFGQFGDPNGNGDDDNGGDTGNGNGAGERRRGSAAEKRREVREAALPDPADHFDQAERDRIRHHAASALGDGTGSIRNLLRLVGVTGPMERREFRDVVETPQGFVDWYFDHGDFQDIEGVGPATDEKLQAAVPLVREALEDPERWREEFEAGEVDPGGVRSPAGVPSGPSIPDRTAGFEEGQRVEHDDGRAGEVIGVPNETTLFIEWDDGREQSVSPGAVEIVEDDDADRGDVSVAAALAVKRRIVNELNSDEPDAEMIEDTLDTAEAQGYIEADAAGSIRNTVRGIAAGSGRFASTQYKRVAEDVEEAFTEGAQDADEDGEDAREADVQVRFDTGDWPVRLPVILQGQPGHPEFEIDGAVPAEVFDHYPDEKKGDTPRADFMRDLASSVATQLGGRLDRAESGEKLGELSVFEDGQWTFDPAFDVGTAFIDQAGSDVYVKPDGAEIELGDAVKVTYHNNLSGDPDTLEGVVERIRPGDQEVRLELSTGAVVNAPDGAVRIDGTQRGHMRGPDFGVEPLFG